MKRRGYRPAGNGHGRGERTRTQRALHAAWWDEFTGRAPERTTTPLKRTHATRGRTGGRR